MINANVEKGHVKELHAEGNTSQLLAEATCLVRKVCYLMSEQEKTEFNKMKVYASLMLMVADGLTEILKNEKVFEKLESLANKSET